MKQKIKHHITGYRKIILPAAIILLMTTCTKKFEQINTDQNSIPTIGPAEIPFLFSSAQSASTIQWIYQDAQNLHADQYAQYFTCTATSFPTDRLVVRLDWLISFYEAIYNYTVPQLQSIFEATEPDSPEYALADVMWVFAFHKLTDYWGPIPYFNAGVPGASVPYDAQDKIYDDFFKRLSAAVTVLKNNTNARPYGSFDLIYGGDVNKWIKFASSLRLRLALRISKVDPARAKTEAEAAYADGVMMSSPDDDALIERSTKGDDVNGLSIMSDWNEFRMSASMESVLKGYDDPRMKEYFLPAVATGTYEGIRNGLSVAQMGETINDNDNNSHVGARWSSPAAGGIAEFLSTPQNIMATAEAYFLRAEGAMLGWNMGGTAKELYEAGISNSMKQWGITDETVINNYINSTTTPVAPNDYFNSPPMTNIPVRFGATADVQAEQIATQKWLAVFPDGMEGWADYRRSHVLKLYPVVNSDNPDITDPTTQWLRRIPFLLTERQVNGVEVEKAVELLNGPDKTTTPLWWDKN